MKKKVIAGVLCTLMALAACGCGSENSSSKADTASSTAAASTAESTAESAAESTAESAAESEADSPYTLNGDFSKGADTVKWMASDGWSNGSMFNCTWKGTNAVFEDGLLKLRIDKMAWDDGYSGGEYRTNDFYGYGLYEVSMKPIKNVGVVSSFFTYTGPSDNNPWDEIDIEFLGKDTTKVQFNYFTNGQGNHEKLYDLGFDATEEFHTYGFRWSKDSITWYVDGKEVHKATESIPVTPSKIMMNVWNGKGVDSWLGKYNGKTPLTAEYQWARFTAEA
ncbi:Beta-glucanase, GH16 family [Ruminococcaceae bacterium FB2012]|nr:Beta-glucanase, GH16 family [Ruminococcaceae bacterium FB2012]